jgi:hypothetical protein
MYAARAALSDLRSRSSLPIFAPERKLRHRKRLAQ